MNFRRVVSPLAVTLFAITLVSSCASGVVEEVPNTGASGSSTIKLPAGCVEPTQDEFLATLNEVNGLKMADFVNRQASKEPCWTDWTSDGCTDLPNSGKKFDFANACSRLDFSYRNLSRGETWFDAKVWTKTNKAVADSAFKQDATDHCWTRKEAQIDACLEARTKYYNLVSTKEPMTGGLEVDVFKIG